MKSVENAHQYIDRFMTVASMKSAQQGKPITCRGAGCFACCKEPVYVEEREARHILEHVPAAELDGLRARVRSWLAGFVSHHFGDVRGPREPKEERGSFKTLTRYRAANLYCPLLVAGKCSAYQQRPAGCRYHVVVGDPEDCADDVRRRHQLFMVTAEQVGVNARAVEMMFGNEEEPLLTFDHLGVWLAILLLNEGEHSGAAVGFQFHK